MACFFLDRILRDPVPFIKTLSQKHVLLLLILVTTGSLLVSHKVEGAMLNNRPVSFPDSLSIQLTATDTLHEVIPEKRTRLTAPRISGTDHGTTSLRFKWVLTATLLLLLLAIGIIIYFRRRLHLQTTAFHNLLNEEKKLRHSLQNSEEKFRRLFHTSPDSITLSNLDGKYVEINNGFCNAIGYTPEEALGKSPSELHIWQNIADRERLLNTLEQTGHAENIEAEFRCKNGSTVNGLLSATTMEIDGVPHILAITRDISNYKKQQKKLQKAEQRWRNTFDAITDCITVWDADMHILQANRAARNFFPAGEPDDDGSCVSALREQEGCNAACPVSQTFVDGQPHCTVIKHKKSGSTFMVTSHPIFSHRNTVKVARDITKQLALEQKRILLITAIEQSSETIIITDPDGKIQYVNPAFERHTGYSRTEALDKNPHILKSGKHNQSFYHQLWAIILSGKKRTASCLKRRQPSHR